MKKIILISILLLLILPIMVVAKSQQGKVVLTIANRTETKLQEGLLIRVEETQQFRNVESEEIQNKMSESPVTVIVESDVLGLENAILHVDNIVAKERLQQNIERFQEKYKYKYFRMDVVEIEETTVIDAKRKVRFLFFEFSLRDQYAIDDKGLIIAENRNFWSKVFTRETTGE